MRILSIQSHVVSGYVGNKSAAFPLQILGFDVDCVNAVQFSNHTGYDRGWKGSTLDGQCLLDIYEGLRANDLHHYSHLLTGYIGNASVLEALVAIIKQLKQADPDVFVVVDPVLGDDGSFYVKDAAALVGMYRTQIVPLATILTPNQFELEAMAQMKVASHREAKRACAVLHSLGCRIVVVTTITYGSNDCISLLASEKDDGGSLLICTVPKINSAFTGTGDLLAALILAHYTKTNHDLVKTLETAISSVQQVLAQTVKDNIAHPHTPAPELRLIQSKAHIENPEIVCKIEKIQV